MDRYSNYSIRHGVKFGMILYVHMKTIGTLLNNGSRTHGRIQAATSGRAIWCLKS